MDVESKVRAIVAEFANVDKSTVERKTRFRANLGMDSLDLVELTIAVEDEFDIDLQFQNPPEIYTVGELVDHIASKMVPA